MSELPAQMSHVYPIDRFLHANEARMTAGLSPSSAMLAYLDWAVHLANSPGKQAELVQKAFRKSVKFGAYLERLASSKEECACIEPLPQDRRFRAPDWRQPPFSFYYQAFLFLQQWWHNATVGVHGVSSHHEDVVAFSGPPGKELIWVFTHSSGS